MGHDLISVVVPVYNVHSFLDNCVKSILNQTYKNIEIILVDDGSTDDSGLICDSYAKIDNRVKVIHKTNGGLSDARNVGIKNANGMYITFVDSDDEIELDYVEYLYNLIHSNDMSICSYSIITNNKKIDYGKNHEDIIMNTEECLGSLLKDDGFTVSACAKLYKKDLFLNIEFPKGKICEDIGTTYKLIDRCKSISYGHESKYNYFRRTNSIMRSTFTEKKLDMITFTDEMCDYIVSQYPNLKDVADNRKVYARLSVLRQIAESDNRKNFGILIKQLKDQIKSLNKKNLTKKEKMAILSLNLGFNVFAFNWKVFKYFKYKE